MFDQTASGLCIASWVGFCVGLVFGAYIASMKWTLALKELTDTVEELDKRLSDMDSERSYPFSRN